MVPSKAIFDAGLRIRITLMRIRIQLFPLMRIQIQLLFKVPGIFHYWSIDPPGLHFEPLKLLNSEQDPDPAFHSNADPDSASKNNEDPSGSASLL
jgi:hypothetical protein